MERGNAGERLEVEQSAADTMIAVQHFAFKSSTTCSSTTHLMLQVLLVNPICALAFAIISWRFFSVRIP